MDHPRIALLIDADNASVRRIELILNELSGVGETSIRRAYGNWTKPELKGWAAVLLEHAIRPMQQYDYSTGKNASDMALVVDAMALYYTDRPDAFAIVSSDGDFTPLVMHLREKGAAVYGFGDHKTPEAFKSACSRFLVLDRLDVQEQEVEEAGEAAAGTPSGRTPLLRVPTAQLKQDAKLVTLLRRAVQAAAAKGLTLDAHRSRRLTAEMAAAADLIVALDEFVEDQILVQLGDVPMELWPVADPFGGPEEGYRRAIQEIAVHVAEFVQRLKSGSGPAAPTP